MRNFKQNEPRFAVTITGMFPIEYDEVLTRLLKDHPDYNVETIQIVKEEKKIIMQNLGYDGEEIPVETPFVWATVILAKKTDK